MHSRVPRIEFNDLEPELQELLRARVERLGYLGEFFRASAHVADGLSHFIRFTESIKGNVPKNLTEVAILTVASAKKNAYELHQHERLCVRSGFDKEWIAEVEQCEPHAAKKMNQTEVLIQKYVLAVLENDADVASQNLNLIASAFDNQTAVSLMMIVGRYVAHSGMIISLGIGPIVPSIWEDGFTG